MENTPELASIFDALGNERRLKTFLELSNGTPVKDIPDEVGVARSTVQNYLNKLGEANLIQKREGRYQLTDRGTAVHEWTKGLDELVQQVGMLQVMRTVTDYSDISDQGAIAFDSANAEHGSTPTTFGTDEILDKIRGVGEFDDEEEEKSGEENPVEWRDEDGGVSVPGKKSDFEKRQEEMKEDDSE